MLTWAMYSTHWHIYVVRIHSQLVIRWLCELVLLCLHYRALTALLSLVTAVRLQTATRPTMQPLKNLRLLPNLLVLLLPIFLLPLSIILNFNISSCSSLVAVSSLAFTIPSMAEFKVIDPVYAVANLSNFKSQLTLRCHHTMRYGVSGIVCFGIV